MKHLSLYLTVLLLGGVPLSAAAFDYGSNSPLLAADTNAPQVPGASARDARGEMPKPDVMAVDANSAGDVADTGEAAPAPATRRMAPSTSSPRALPAPRNPGGSASNKPRLPAAHPAPATASWQSLLPGSIQ